MAVSASDSSKSTEDTTNKPLPTPKGDYTYTNILVFLVVTLVYFAIVKPKLTIGELSNQAAYLAFSKKSRFMLIIYFLAVVILQFVINTMSMVNKCGGSIAVNMRVAAFYTFIPWFFIFGIMMAVLLIFPGFKGAFSDVVGYFCVAGTANNVLTTLLIDPKVQNNIDEMKSVNTEGHYPNPSAPPLAEAEMSAIGESEKTKANPIGTTTLVGGGEKEAMQDAADAIIKLCGNMSILINQIVPDNFTKYWTMLQPLMKDEYKNQVNPPMKQKLLDVVVTRDNIGEAMWYIYTAILLISIVQFKLVSHGCSQNADTVMANYSLYDNKVTADLQKNAKSEARSYVVE